MSDSPSTQLRALEWEIAEINAQPLPVSTNRKNTKRKAAVCDVLLTLAKELEAALAHEVEERDYARKELAECNKDTSAEIQSIRAENATLKRRLDEAMKELLMVKVGFEITGPSKAVEYIDHRITEIDKL